MAIELIGFAGSGSTIPVVAVLKELGLTYKFSPPAKVEDIKTPEYLATKHPFGKVPVLIDNDGFQVYESRAIARYLTNKYQKTKNSTILMPSDVQKAALVNQFLSVENSYFSVPVTKLAFQETYVKFKGGTADPEIVKEACKEISDVLDIYEKFLEGKDYLAGEFSLADIFHCVALQYFEHFGHSDLVNNPKRPNVARWWKNLSGRECWKNTMAENPFKDA